MHTHGDLAARGEQMTIKYLEERSASLIAFSSTPPARSVVSLNTGRTRSGRDGSVFPYRSWQFIMFQLTLKPLCPLFILALIRNES